MEYIFQLCDGVCFLVKLQAYSIDCIHTTCLCRFTTGSRIHVFIRNRYKNKQAQICQFYEWVKAHAYENVGQFCPNLFCAKKKV